ncbi:MAG: Gfo/Idh/MocA family oxidoreductase [Candidatus Heimdallarchaeota archaeon]|nr:Gfo/Idh/MocA family oxidoreductase [Candidatus Heimdallarchaeota archaeon]
MNINVWIIGAGNIGIEYAKILEDLKIEYTLITRSVKSANYAKKSINAEVISGGLIKYIENTPTLATHAIVSTQINFLSEITIQLLEIGIQNILIEKPGGLSIKELCEIDNLAEEKNSKVYIAYNRRYFSSVLKTIEIVKNRNNITSFHFEFTEWSHKINTSMYPKEVLNNWIISNSSHLIDLAFYICGSPKVLHSTVKGKLDWHPTGSIFTGSGETGDEIPFTYFANWISPGRWSLEILTKTERIILRPLETLKIQKIDSLTLDEYPIDNVDDINYKPGYFKQTKEFINNSNPNLLTIKEQINNFKNIYYKIYQQEE